MSTRAAGALQEDMEYMGPVRMSDIRDAQAKITAVMMSLAVNAPPNPEEREILKQWHERHGLI